MGKGKGDQMKSLLVKLVVILIGLTIFTYAEAWGADWRLYLKNEELHHYSYYDAESIKDTSNNIVRLQTKMVSIDSTGRDEFIKFRKRHGLSIKGYENFSYAVSELEINCVNRLAGLISIHDYDKRKKLLSSFTLPPSEIQWDYITYTNVLDIVFKAACGRIEPKGAIWSYIWKDDDGNYFYDTKNIMRQSEGIIGVWHKMIYTRKDAMIQRLRKTIIGKEFDGLNYSVTLSEINCIDKSFRGLSATHFSQEGDILYTTRSDEILSNWIYIPLNTLSEAIYKELCK
jgi:hypothetical protein